MDKKCNCSNPKRLPKISQFVTKTGKINCRRLFAYTNPIQDIDRPKSDLTPSALATHPCAPDIDLDVYRKQFATALITLRKRNIALYYIALIQLSTGARISQVLNLHYSFITKSGTALLQAVKFSNPVIVNIPELYSFFISCKYHCVSPFDEFNRFYVYREYLKAGFYIPNVNHNRNAVTHSPRYLIGTAFQEISPDLSASKQALNHKSINSTKHYAKQ